MKGLNCTSEQSKLPLVKLKHPSFFNKLSAWWTKKELMWRKTIQRMWTIRQKCRETQSPANITALNYVNYALSMAKNSTKSNSVSRYGFAEKLPISWSLFVNCFPFVQFWLTTFVERIVWKSNLQQCLQKDGEYCKGLSRNMFIFSEIKLSTVHTIIWNNNRWSILFELNGTLRIFLSTHGQNCLSL